MGSNLEYLWGKKSFWGGVVTGFWAAGLCFLPSYFSFPFLASKPCSHVTYPNLTICRCFFHPLQPGEDNPTPRRYCSGVKEAWAWALLVSSTETRWMAAAESPPRLFLEDSFLIKLLHILSLCLRTHILENTLIFLWKRILFAIPAGFVWADGTNKKGTCNAAYTPASPQKTPCLVEYAYIYK